MRIAAIINPISGAGADPARGAKRVEVLKEQLERRGLRAAMTITTHAGHARELATAAADEGVDLVVVWGGDGTVNEAGAALLGSETALGLVPAGSGNGLAAALSTPHDPVAAIGRALDGRRQAIDAGVMAGRPFFNIAGIGVDARIARRFNARELGSRGPWPYIAIGVIEGCRYRSQEYEIDLDGDSLRLRALLIAFANGREYGNGAKLSATASLDDGLLDAVIVQDRSVVARFWHARHLASGSPGRAPRVTTRQITTATIRAAGPMEYHVDGETGAVDREIAVSIRPRTLWVMR